METATPLSADMRRSRSILGRIVGVAMVCLVILVLAGALAFTVLVIWVRAEHFAALKAVEQEVARIQAAGESITPADMYAFHALPPGEPNSTPLWLSVLESFDQDQFESDAKSVPFVSARAPQRVTLDETHLPAAEAFLAEYQSTIEAAKTAAKHPGDCRFPVKFEDGVGAELAHARKMRSLISLLRLETRMHIEHNAVDSAIESIENLLAAARALENQPSMVEQLIRNVAIGEAIAEAENLLNCGQLHEQQLERLAATLSEVSTEEGLRTGLLGERALMYQYFCNVGPPGVVSLTHGARIGLEPGPATDCRKYVEVMAHYVAASSLSFPGARDAARLTEEDFKAEVNQMSSLKKAKLASSVSDLPGTQEFFIAMARIDANCKAASAAIAAEQFRRVFGAYPRQLADLHPEYLPEVPLDPFDGLPMKLRTTHEEVVVYSVGRDLSDDGGNDAPGTATSGTSDIAFRVRSAKAEAQ